MTNQTSEVKETSGTALFVYGMAWGVRNGLLDRKEYLPVLLKAWNAMVKDAVHPNGFLGLVQGTGKKNRKTVNLSHTIKYPILKILE